MRVFANGSSCLRLSFTLAFCAISALPASASVIYNVTVNTSAISGSSGNLDFQFNPGGGSFQAATAGIFGFTSTGGTLGATILTGAAAGALPAAVTLNNTTAFNDLYQSFSFGTAFQFQLVFSGPAIDSPNGTSAAGSSFGLSLFNSDGSATLLTTNADGFAGSAQINLDGSVSTFVYPSDPSGSAPVVTFIPVQGVPEPSSLSLLLLPLAGLALSALRRKIKS